MTNSILQGKPDAGNSHVWSDVGGVASAKPRRWSLCDNAYKMKTEVVLLLLAGAVLSVEAALRPSAMETLPLGSVKAEGWLRRQLEKQRDGLTGHGEEIYWDIGKSDWLTNAGRKGEYEWERGPYYAKGLVALAFVLDDPELKGKAKRWVDAAIGSQRENGDFGPKRDNWWANMIALHYLRDWAAATGDERVEPFLRKYFGYQAARLREHPLAADSAWAKCRVGDEIEVVLWLADRTHDESLVRFAEFLLTQAADWTTYYHDGGDGCWGDGYRCHIVNFMQGLKLPALRWRLGGDERDRTAYRAAFAADGWAMRQHGRLDRMVNGTEPLAGRSPSQGTELCAIAERILSCRETVAMLGDLAAADDMEIVAYNTLPACLGDDGRGVRYYQLLNQPECVVGRHLGFECNGNTGSVTPGPHAGYGCCRSNFHFAWPKFVQSMWMRKDGGLAAIAYGPSTVTAKLPSGEVTLRTVTDYPFAGRVTIRVEKGGGRFPIFTRIPGWAKLGDAGSFRRQERVWKPGDEIALEFPMETEVEPGLNESVGVRRGPLVYALKIDADVSVITNKPASAAFPVREYRAKTPWNYALVCGADAKWAFSVVAGAVGDDPFVHGTVPCALKTRAVRTGYAGWGTFRPNMRSLHNGRPLDPPVSPIPREKGGAEEEITLVPLGSTQVRLTLFPWLRKAAF